jgi:hypothetical protein
MGVTCGLGAVTCGGASDDVVQIAIAFESEMAKGNNLAFDVWVS